MKKSLFILLLLISFAVFSQTKTTITVSVPNKTDAVFITGNQESLGNWQVDHVKMKKVSDYERAIEVELNFPAEFKFTRGNWESEGLTSNSLNSPNLRIEDKTSETNFKVKTWMDDIDTQALGLDYDIQFIDSEYMGVKRMLKIYLPPNYTTSKAYPVIYLTDAQSTNFEVAKGYMNALWQPNFDIIPESILVGINQKERNDDFYRKNTGKYFTEFLIEEVVPYIDNKYNTSGFNAMIGHSNGAEYNHVMMMEDNNPFRGFISMSTRIKKKDNVKLSEFFKNYKGDIIYYFLANSNLDAPSRHEWGNKFEKLYQSSPNKDIKFVKHTVEGNHQTIVPNSLLEGLKFIYQDYNNIEKYPTIMDLDKNYLTDLKQNYGVKGQFILESIESYYIDIIAKKSKSEWEYLLDFIEKKKLWFGRGLDQVNIANGYYAMQMYPETIEAYNKAIDDIENCEDIVFYVNIHRPIDSYIKEGKTFECISFLERARAAIPKEYYLGMTYHIAKLSIENQLDLNKGKEALTYCKDHFKKNILFNNEDLKTLENLL